MGAVSENAAPRLSRRADHWCGAFEAMASPCEVLCSGVSQAQAREALALAAAESWRIEAKFSRYRDDSIIHTINNSGGRPVELDAETARLLDFAAQCHALSGGSFDITAGVLGRVWCFDGGDRVPAADAIQALLEHVGWHRVEWTPPRLRLPDGMQIDLGGIGKEYAVDRVAQQLGERFDGSFLVNFGGDIAATGPRRAPEGDTATEPGSLPWNVGVEDPEREDHATRAVEIEQGGLATSGDARRFLLREGVRYGHILDPRSGWPIANAPRSVTVRAGSCTEAGLLATLAILNGEGAEEFLKAQDVEHWVIR